jgi:D-alanine-D-alanine ligase
MKLGLLIGDEAAAAPDPVIAQIEAVADRAGHEITRLVVQRDVAALATALAAAQPDLVLNLAESFAGKSALESNLAALLNLLDLRYTGSSPTTLALAGDKSLSKKVLAFHGIRTPEFAILYRGSLDWAGDLEFPLIVKPPQEDGSLGITSKSVVRDVKELLETIGQVHTEFQQPVLVEQYIVGREFYVGVLGNESAEALPVIELDFTDFPADRPRMATFDAKWGENASGAGAEHEGTAVVFPEDLGEDLVARMGQVALESFHALRLRDYGRIDLRVTDSGDIYVIEVNPNCYLEAESEFALAAARAGYEYDALLARIVELASARYAR